MNYKPSYKWNDDERYCEACLHWDCGDQPILDVIDVFRQLSQSFKEDLFKPFPGVEDIDEYDDEDRYGHECENEREYQKNLKSFYKV